MGEIFQKIFNFSILSFHFQHIVIAKRMTFTVACQLRQQVKTVIRPIHVCQKRRNAMDIWIVVRDAMKTDAQALNVV